MMYKDEEEAAAPNDALANIVNQIPKSNPVFIGAGINTSVRIRGHRETETMEEVNILGPHKKPRNKYRREMILNMLRQCNL